tara:strand:+ start:3081 stop:4121 length:1041 start_codon:yes stop_codon:yes gene_type:complete
VKKYSYSKSGVSINKGNKFVSEIKNILNKNNNIKTQNIGGFAGLFPINKNIKNPILVSATDGVGTKLEIADKLGKHDTIGIDLVAMCVNDIIVTRAKPLFFLDYLATGRLNLKIGKSVIKGIVNGCRQAGCVLLGGETAEHPGVFPKNKYDLAGFSVGVIDKKDLNKKTKLKDGDLLIGIESSGAHSNGYSLIRKILKDKKISLSSILPDSKKTIGKSLIEPTKIYVDPILDLYNKNILKSCAHITGGGITENLPRVITKNLCAHINLGNWKLPPLFKWIMSMGVSEKEMLKTFNCGYGMIAIIDKKSFKKFNTTLKKYKLKSTLIGELKNKKKNIDSSIFFSGSL